MWRKRLAPLLGFITLTIYLGNGAFGHNEGAPFSAAVIDPLIVHHAHLEDEQRLNLFFAKPE